MNGRPEVDEGVAKAEVDDKAALELARRRRDPLPDAVCFHCQQCAEKYLKAFLVLRRTPFPKVHDLIALNTLCSPEDAEFDQIVGALECLVGYDVAVRYPGESATVEDIHEAVEAMQQVRTFVRQKLAE